MGSQTLFNLQRLLGYLPRQRVISLGAQLMLSVVPGVLDLLAVAVVARLTGVLSGSALEDSLPGIHVFGGDRPDQSLWLISLFILLAWTSSLSKLLLRYFQNSISAQIWRDLTDEAYGRVLRQKYVFHLGTTTAELGAQILQNFERISSCTVRPLLQAFSAIFSVVLLSVGILFVGRLVAAGLLIGLALAYWSITVLITPNLRHSVRQRLRQERESASLLYETLSSIRDIHLTSSEPYFQGQFELVGKRSVPSVVLGEVLPDLPRGLVEPLGITLIFAIGVAPALLSGQGSSIVSILPFLATMAVAALRLTGPLQDLFRAVTMLRGSLPMVGSALDLLDLPGDRPTLRTPGVPTPGGVLPRHSVRLHDVYFRYSHQESWILNAVNLSIPVGSRVALVGPTGSGKSTIANILLGFLQPERGQLQLDGIDVEELDLPAWQSNCAQVPQAISLLNRSIVENIAFGVQPDSVDLHRVWDALEAAQLHELVSELPYGLYTQVGENGLRLSGGQRQRLALARAFYRQASFLVLDEATSALDNRTESEVIEALEVIGRRCTTVVIAHRLSTIKRCDLIYELENGKVNACGDYEELRRSSPSFRHLALLEERQSL